MDLSEKNIIVIDDSKTMRSVIKKFLISFGFKKLHFARNGVEGIDLIKNLQNENTKIDLILSDINMPQMNGLLMAKKLIADKMIEGVPVVFVTAETGNDTKVDIDFLPGASVIYKPFKDSSLQSIVYEHFGVPLKVNDIENQDKEAGANIDEAIVESGRSQLLVVESGKLNRKIFEKIIFEIEHKHFEIIDCFNSLSENCINKFECILISFTKDNIADQLNDFKEFLKRFFDFITTNNIRFCFAAEKECEKILELSNSSNRFSHFFHSYDQEVIKAELSQFIFSNNTDVENLK